MSKSCRNRKPRCPFHRVHLIFSKDPIVSKMPEHCPIVICEPQRIEICEKSLERDIHPLGRLENIYNMGGWQALGCIASCTFHIHSSIDPIQQHLSEDESNPNLCFLYMTDDVMFQLNFRGSVHTHVCRSSCCTCSCVCWRISSICLACFSICIALPFYFTHTHTNMPLLKRGCMHE